MNAVNAESPVLTVLDLARGFVYPAALRAAALLGVADHLADGPRTPAELAAATGSHAQFLHRTLRLLAARGVFREDAEGRIHLTPEADALRTDSPSSVRAAVLMFTEKPHWLSAGELATSIRQGKPSFDHIFGAPLFDYLAGDEEIGTVFHNGMRSVSESAVQLIVDNYDFPASGTMIDVGGGQGGFLLRALRENPGLRGVLFDQEHVVAGNWLTELEADHRWELATGDFFTEVPAGGDIYALKHVLHDWTDEECVRILRNCRQAMAPDGRVLVVEWVVPEGDEPDTSKTLDIFMMILLNGRERTEAEFRKLFTDAGLLLTRVISMGSSLSILECAAS